MQTNMMTEIVTNNTLIIETEKDSCSIVVRNSGYNWYQGWIRTKYQVMYAQL